MNIFTSNRLENLLDSLAQDIDGKKQTPKSIFSQPAKVVIIQSQGMSKWLNQNLAEKLDISAHIDFPFLKSFILNVLKNYGYNSHDNIWDRETLCWRIFKLLPKFEEKFEVLNSYIAGEEQRRHQLAEQLATLFDNYMIYRSDWIQAWSKGRRASIKPGLAMQLDNSHEEWQSELWQELTAKVRQETFLNCLLRFIRKRNFTREQLQLPETISIFGITNIPPIFISFFESLTSVCEVNLYYLNPCEAFWGDMPLFQKAILTRDEPDEVPELPEAHALLKSWGLLGRDFFNLLLERTEFHDNPNFTAHAGDSALELIQNGILEMSDFFESPLPHDKSICINACHNARRELDVLHDYLLDILKNNPEVQPRDIIVMAPKIQEYAPYIKSIFSEENPLPFSISDQELSASPFINTYGKILQLAQTRLSSNDILDIIEHPDILSRFKLSTDDVPLIRDWLRDASIRWGKDAAHRADLDLPAFEQNSWKFGFDRLLAGYAFADECLYEDSLAVPIQENGLLLGRFKAAVDKLLDIYEELQKPHQPTQWCQLLFSILDDCFTTDSENSNECAFISQAITQLESHWALAEIDEPLSPAIAIQAFESLISEPSSSYGFLDNGITFCSLLPMRSIPAKVVCMLGIDDGVYPRTDRQSGFDIMSSHWRQGDRTMRLDDRYLFLESLLSARNFFYVSYTGLDENENTSIPPSVVLTEFIEFIQRAQADFKVTEHPLHPFSDLYFDGHLPSYSLLNFTAAEKRRQDSAESRLFCPESLTFSDSFYNTEGFAEIQLSQLIHFFKQPAAHFLQHQLGTSLWQNTLEELPDTEEFDAPGGLEKYTLRQRVLKSLLQQGSLNDHDNKLKILQTLKKSELARGELPYGQQGEDTLDQTIAEVDDFAQRLFSHQQDQQESQLDINLKFDDLKVNLSGKVNRIFGDNYLPYHLGGNSFKHEFTNTINYLALCQEHHLSMFYQVLSKNEAMNPTALSQERAQQHLKDLVKLYLTGLKKPLPFLPDCFNEFLKKKDTEEAFKAASKKWYPDKYSDFESPSENEANSLCFGSQFPGDNPHFQEAVQSSFQEIKDIHNEVWGKS
jgi:exodeoxyribonuclease V gamma subunit